MSSGGWKSKIKDVGRSDFSWSPSLWLTDGHLLAVSLHGLCSMRACRRCHFLFLEGHHSCRIRAPPLRPQFNHNYLPKGPISKYSHIWRWRLQHRNYGDSIQSVTMLKAPFEKHRRFAEHLLCWALLWVFGHRLTSSHLCTQRACCLEGRGSSDKDWWGQNVGLLGKWLEMTFATWKGVQQLENGGRAFSGEGRKAWRIHSEACRSH